MHLPLRRTSIRSASSMTWTWLRSKDVNRCAALSDEDTVDIVDSPKYNSLGNLMASTRMCMTLTIPSCWPLSLVTFIRHPALDNDVSKEYVKNCRSLAKSCNNSNTKTRWDEARRVGQWKPVGCHECRVWETKGLQLKLGSRLVFFCSCCCLFVFLNVALYVWTGVCQPLTAFSVHLMNNSEPGLCHALVGQGVGKQTVAAIQAATSRHLHLYLQLELQLQLRCICRCRCCSRCCNHSPAPNDFCILVANVPFILFQGATLTFLKQLEVNNYLYK